jgi:flagellar hook-associated protein 1 FlgK
MAGFSGIQVALQALLSQQQALDITQNNVANANTKGYHRQEAVMKAGFPTRSMAFTNSAGAQNIGTGVYVESIKRFSLDFYDARYRNQLGENSKFNMMSSMLSEVEINLSDTSSDGIAKRMDDFFAGWQTVATDPDISAVRDDLLERTKSMTEAFNNRALRLIQIQQDQNLALTQRVDDINKIATQIGELNSEIGRTQGSSTQPNAQLDERDRLLDQLSQLIGVTSHLQDNGQVLVSLQGHALVLGNRTFALEATPGSTDNTLVQINWAEDPDNTALKEKDLGGEVAGILHTRDVVMEDQKKKLNDTVVSLMNRVNAIHRSGFDLDGNPGVDLFVATAGQEALSFAVNPAITNSRMIAAATETNAQGDGNNALAISNSMSTAIFPVRVPPITALTPAQDPVYASGEDSISHFNSSRVTSLALEIRHAKTGAADSNNLLSGMDDQREQVSGVNMDEEAANMVKYQRAYQAAVRLMNTMDAMLEEIVTNLGLVGR